MRYFLLLFSTFRNRFRSRRIAVALQARTRSFVGIIDFVLFLLSTFPAVFFNIVKHRALPHLAHLAEKQANVKFARAFELPDLGEY